MTQRISALLLALTFALGVAAHGVQAHGMNVSDIGLKMTAAAGGDMPMSGKCDGCGDDQKGVAPAVCFAYCGSVVALPVAVVAFTSVPAKILQYSAHEDGTGRVDSPEPYPPRPPILS